MLKTHEALATKIFQSVADGRQPEYFFRCRHQARSTKRLTVRYLESLCLVSGLDATFSVEEGGIRGWKKLTDFAFVVPATPRW